MGLTVTATPFHVWSHMAEIEKGEEGRWRQSEVAAMMLDRGRRPELARAGYASSVSPRW